MTICISACHQLTVKDDGRPLPRVTDIDGFLSLALCCITDKLVGVSYGPDIVRDSLAL